MRTGKREEQLSLSSSRLSLFMRETGTGKQGGSNVATPTHNEHTVLVAYDY